MAICRGGVPDMVEPMYIPLLLVRSRIRFCLYIHLPGSAKRHIASCEIYMLTRCPDTESFESFNLPNIVSCLTGSLGSCRNILIL